MRAPLVEIRDKVLGFRSDVEMSLSELKCGLRERNVASEAREVLELLIDTSHVVSKVVWFNVENVECLYILIAFRWICCCD